LGGSNIAINAALLAQASRMGAGPQVIQNPAPLACQALSDIGGTAAGTFG